MAYLGAPVQEGGGDLLVCEPWIGGHNQEGLLEKGGHHPGLVVGGEQLEENGNPIFLCVLLPSPCLSPAASDLSSWGWNEHGKEGLGELNIF